MPERYSRPARLNIRADARLKLIQFLVEAKVHGKTWFGWRTVNLGLIDAPRIVLIATIHFDLSFIVFSSPLLNCLLHAHFILPASAGVLSFITSLRKYNRPIIAIYSPSVIITELILP